MKKYAGEIRLYNIRNVLFRNQRHAYAERYKINLKYQLKIFVYQGLLQMIRFALCSAAVAAYIAYVVKVRHVTPAQMGTYISVLATSGFITWKVYEGITQMIEAGKNCINMNNLRDFLETDECKSPAEDVVPVAHDETLGDIDIENISFAYDGAPEPVIRNLTMKIHKGEKIALVGENGAGKTTLIKLLMGLYQVTDGVISVNGKNINSYERQSYRSRFGTVFQDLQVFSLPLVENVLLREPRNEADVLLAEDSLEKAQFGDKLAALPLGVKTSVTKEFDDEGFICSGGQTQKIAIARVFAKKPDIVILDEPSSALDLAGFTGKYKKLPHGLDTEMTREFCDEGTMLSGGETQKVAISRMFAKHEKQSGTMAIAILDEPSSALDPQAEALLNKNMLEAAGDASVIFISHRLSTTRDADRIYLFKNGTIAEQIYRMMQYGIRKHQDFP